MFAVLIDGPHHLTQIAVRDKKNVIRMYKPLSRVDDFSSFGREDVTSDHVCGESVYRLICETEKNTLIYQLID